MGIDATIAEDWHAALAALTWQYDLGVDEATGDLPLNRYELAEVARSLVVAAPALQPALQPVLQIAPDVPPADYVALARAQADAANSIDALVTALQQFDHCELKRGARNTVFADGNPAARVMVLTEPPSVDEDRSGRPMVGPVGDLFDRMFAAIGLTRASAEPATSVYVATVVPWKPAGNHEVTANEIAMLMPFVERHIALANPDVIVVMGNVPLLALTGQKGVMRARGSWGTALGKPMLVMAPPDYIARTPIAKREAWADLLALRAWLQGAGQP